MIAHQYLWGPDQLHECLAILCKRSGLVKIPKELSPMPDGLDIAKWIEHAAQHLGCETHSLETTYAELPTDLRFTYPAIIAVSPGSYLAITGCRGNKLSVMTPSSTTATVPIVAVCRAIREPDEQPHRGGIESLLDNARITGKSRASTIRLMLDERIGARRFNLCWILRPTPGAGVLQWLKQSGAIRNGTALLAAHTAQYLVWLGSWALLGSLSFAGHMDRGWLAGWALLLATIVPCRVLATWLQGRIAIGVGGQLKRRLLYGALRLEPEEIRHLGIGQFLGQALEAESLEGLALGGGIGGLLAIVDLVVSGFILGQLALLLAVWAGLAVAIGYRFLLKFQHWSATRLDMTHDLVESMVGHRTRLAQQRPEQWHASEDQALDGYLTTSLGVDRIGTVLVAALPRGWLVLSLSFLAPAVISGQTSAPQTAMALGGILLAFTAFDRMVSSFSEIAVAWIAWKRVGPLFKAAARPQLLGHISPLTSPPPHSRTPSRRVLLRASAPFALQAEKLEFRYRQRGNPVLQDCTLTIREGDRILLEGSSGGGKTTFASLLSGTRQPDSGLLLAGGLDIHSLGAAGWRERIVAAPQFHENHILTETLAFNLLFGRCWPPAPGDFEEAESVCRSLGLGSLLDHMPSGLLQMVGDGGWQLSHGECSRIYIARALLQNPELIILDESFGALDPENLRIALEFTLERARTLLVIAHP
jgi:ATP-binding cassette subfamily B protein